MTVATTPALALTVGLELVALALALVALAFALVVLAL
jgi:hypothetical protein